MNVPKVAQVAREPPVSPLFTGSITDLPPSLADAMDKREHILVPQIPREIAQGTIRSAIITPILIEKDCHGAIYADNSREHEHYTIADLDYLMIIAIHTAAIIKKLPN